MAELNVYSVEITVDGNIEHYEVVATGPVHARDLLVMELKPPTVGLHVEADLIGRRADGEPRVVGKIPR